MNVSPTTSSPLRKTIPCHQRVVAVAHSIDKCHTDPRQIEYDFNDNRIADDGGGKIAQRGDGGRKGWPQQIAPVESPPLCAADDRGFYEFFRDGLDDGRLEDARENRHEDKVDRERRQPQGVEIGRKTGIIAGDGRQG